MSDELLQGVPFLGARLINTLPRPPRPKHGWLIKGVVVIDHIATVGVPTFQELSCGLSDAGVSLKVLVQSDEVTFVNVVVGYVGSIACLDPCDDGIANAKIDQRLPAFVTDQIQTRETPRYQ